MAGFAACLGVMLLGGFIGQAQTIGAIQTQTIDLRAGWNAIYLTVDPPDPNPSAVFTNLPVTKVAAFFPKRTPVEFIQDPSSISWKKEGWSVWFAPSLPEFAVSDLYAMHGGHAYLVHSTSSARLAVTGQVRHRRIRWRADSFNFVGLPVDSGSPPTFAAFFAGSTSQLSASRSTIYALNTDGHWQPVTHPDLTQIQPGVAYWIFCQGGSDYQAPVEVSIPTAVQSGQVDFGDTTSTLTLRLSNRTSLPRIVSLDMSPATVLPLSYAKSVPGSGRMAAIPLQGAQNFSLDPNGELDLRLTLDRAAMPRTSGAAVLTARDDVGSLIRIPVIGRLP